MVDTDIQNSSSGRSLAALAFAGASLELASLNEGAFRVIKDLTFSVDSGQFACLIGPSGCGKTTTLNLAAGFQVPSNGRVSWSKRQAVPAMVFQEDAVFAWMTVNKNLAFAQRCNGGATDKELTELLALSGLSKFGNFYPRELSGGMRKRVELCRAWISGRDLLLDEPLAQLDAITRKKQQSVLQRLWLEKPRTVLMVTHDISEAAFLSDKILLMDGPPGRIIRQFDVPFSRPRHSDLRYQPEFMQFQRMVELSMQEFEGDDD